MGAGQSSDRGGGGQKTEIKTSYYELLGIDRQATEEEIKKAYRKKALLLHPDRNFGNEEAATNIFAEIQAAHEVLSDPQERAWYDSHESAILRGDDGGDADGAPVYENVRVTSADDLARMVRKFNSNVDFTDSPSGFFGYLRETFDQLAKEEDIAARLDDSDSLEYPTFGSKNDRYDDVVKRFYSVWSNFATVKSFAWKDQYRLSEAPDRWYRRRMEQENKKCRQDAIREFNDAVRSLVAFVRKRDPRYVPSTQTEAERQKTLRDAAAAQAVRAKAANEAKLRTEEVPSWATSRDHVDDELEGGFSEEEVEEQVLECVACNKIFKSEKQWEAHEKSKKHQKAVYALQKKMRKENAHLDLGGGDGASGIATPEVDEDEFEEEIVEQDEALDDALDLEAVPHPSPDIIGDTKQTADQTTGVNDPTHGVAIDGSPGDDASRLSSPADSDSGADSDYASRETLQARLDPVRIDEPAAPTSDVSKGEEAPGKKLGKAAQKRAKRAAAIATPPGDIDADGDNENKCAGCGAAHQSKTELFKHLKANPKHATLKTAASGGGGKGGKTKGKR